MYLQGFLANREVLVRHFYHEDPREENKQISNSILSNQIFNHYSKGKYGLIKKKAISCFYSTDKFHSEINLLKTKSNFFV